MNFQMTQFGIIIISVLFNKLDFDYLLDIGDEVVLLTSHNT